jgi:beta-galactosidase
MALRDALGSTIPIPAPIPAMAIPDIEMTAMTSIWQQLPAPIKTLTPRTFESFGQNQGLALYRTTLVGRKSGKLTITDLHDFATVFVDGKYVGSLDRRLGEKTIDLPISNSPMPRLEILVEAMGHINFAQDIIDRKGITDRVTLSGMTLMNWETFLLPLDDRWVADLKASPSVDRPGTVFRGSFDLASTADTFIDVSAYRKGVVWVNGHNLGRFWDIGPQTKLYCPASWLKAGKNDIQVLDLLMTAGEAAPLRGTPRS